MRNLKKISNEVYFTNDKELNFINKSHIEFLKSKVKKTKKKRARICLHKDIKDNLHEMIIILSKETYIRPHKHLNKVESLHVIEGSADVIFFNDYGKIINCVRLSKKKNFFYRLSNSKYHTFKIKTKNFIFHETTEGPLIKNRTVYAKWSPEENNLKRAKQYINSL